MIKMKVRMLHGTTEISLDQRMSQIPRKGERVSHSKRLWEVKDVTYDIIKGGIKEVYLHLRPTAEGIDEFNDALGLLFDYFSDRTFDRSEKLSSKELLSQEKPEPIWFRSPCKGPNDKGDKPDGVNIAYYPVNSYSNDKTTLHVRVYNPDEARGVAEVVRSLGLKPSVHDNDPYSKTDIDASLTI
jgi:hypothetical protein